MGEHCPLVVRKVLEAGWGEDMTSATRRESIYSHAFKLIIMTTNHIDPTCKSQ